MYLRFLTLIGVLIFSSSFVYSSCQSPDYIKFTQNSFSQNITAGGGISFKSNLTIYPIQIDYVYSSNQKCYSSDIITLGDGINVILEPILHSFENNLTTIRFSFSDFFIDEFKVLRLHSNGTRINQDFVINSDDEAPNFDFEVYDSNQNRINSPVKVLENLTFKFTFDDSSSTNPSGISHIELDSQKINLDSSNNYVRGIISTKNFLFTIYDKAGNSKQKSVLIEVDSTEPQVMDFINRGVKIVGSSLYFTYSFTVEDENFNGDLSKINISYSQSSRFSNSNLDRPYQCDYLTTNKYTCYVETLVSFGDTFNTDVIISVADDLSNTNTITFTNKEIYIDSMPPVINEFKFVNSQGFENVIAPRVDSNISLYLSFSDDSDVDIIPDFGYITFPYPGNGPCGSGCYSWNFSTGVGSNFDSYIGLETNYEHFYVKLIDDYGYESIANVTLFFDRYAPEIFDIEVSETDSSFVQDSLIESEEKFDVSFKIYENKAIFGENLDASQIFGNFSLVTEERDLINPTNCEVEDDENSDLLIFECMFENLEAKIGYVNSSFEIFAVDKGGNRGELSFEMEIFARTSGDDPTQNRYEIKDISGGNNLKVIAPISRSMLEEGYADVTAWYNGKIIDSSSYDNTDFSIVNYQVVECSDFEIVISESLGNDTLNVQNEKLYPNAIETIYTSERGFEVDREFNMKYILYPYENPSLLNDMQTNCVFSVLYKNSTTIFEPPQMINVTVDLEFYSLPRGHMLRAYAEDLKEDLDEIQDIEDTFGGIYDTYEMFRDTCEVISNVCTLSSSVSTVLTTTGLVLDKIPFLNAIGMALHEVDDSGNGMIQGFCQDEASIINRFCNYVTCEEVLLPGVQDFFEELQFDMSFSTCNALNGLIGGENDDEN